MFLPLQLNKFFIQGRCIELFVPDAEQMQAAYKTGSIAFPYWSKVWPAAVALSEFILRHPQYTQSKKVLELAAGLGLPSIVAAFNASAVISSDYLPEPVDCIRRSALHNGLKNLTASLLNWHLLPEDLQADVVLLSDINYDPGAFEVQHQVVNHFLQKGATLLLSTPQRLMAKEFIAPLLPLSSVQEEILVGQEGREVLITVLVLEGIK